MIVPRSVAFDEGPSPQPMPWAQLYVVGPRTTPEQAQLIRAAGSELIVKIQPCRWLLPSGEPEMHWQWDRSISLIPILRCLDGTPACVDEPGEGMAGTVVLDFSDPNTARQMAKLANELCASLGAIGVMQDYGCLNVSGFGNCPKVDTNVWPFWSNGYSAYLAELMKQKRRVWRCCNHQFSPGAALCVEYIRLYGSLTGYPPSPMQAHNLCVANPGTILLAQFDDPYLRGLIVNAAVSAGGYVDYRPYFFTGDRVSRQPAPELVALAAAGA
jgi:hypothetical protein